MIEDVSFEILSECPNHCVHCSSCSSMESRDIFLLDKIRDIINQLAQLSTRRICLSGGEPFHHMNLLDVVEEITSKGITCDIYTAGVVKNNNRAASIPKDTIVRLLQRRLHRIIFNMQAIDEDKHDFITGTKGQQQHLFASIRNAVESGAETEIHFVPMTYNVDQIEKVLAYAESEKIKQVSFLKLVRHGRAENCGFELSIPEEIAVSRKLTELAKTNPKIRIGIPLTYDNVICSCHAISKKIYIKFDGSVYGCEAFKYVEFEGVEASNVHNDSIRSIIENSEYFNQARQLLCKYKDGGNRCPVQNYMREGEETL